METRDEQLRQCILQYRLGHRVTKVLFCASIERLLTSTFCSDSFNFDIVMSNFDIVSRNTVDNALLLHTRAILSNTIFKQSRFSLADGAGTLRTFI